MFLKSIGEAVRDATVDTVGVVGGTAGGMVGGSAGLIVGTLQGDPMGGVTRGVGAGYNCGSTTGRVATTSTLGVVGVTANVGLKMVDVVGEGVTLGVNGALRGCEAMKNGKFHQVQQSDVATLCAFLAADVYEISKRSQTDRFSSRTITINASKVSVKLKQWSPGTNLRAAVYQVTSVTGTPDSSLKANDLVVSFKGTDFSKEPCKDALDDVFIFLGLYGTMRGIQKTEGDEETGMWKCPKKLKTKFGASRLYVTGHSLGGAAAIIYSSHLDNHCEVTEANVFNPGTGLTQNDTDASNMGDILRGSAYMRPLFKLASALGMSTPKIHIHHIFGDLLSALATGSDLMDVTTYASYGQGATNTSNAFTCVHSIRNFTSKEMDKFLDQ